MSVVPNIGTGGVIRQRGRDQEQENYFVPGNDIEQFYSNVSGRRNVLHDYNTYNYIFTLSSLSKEQVENPDSYANGVLNNGQENSNFYIVAKSGGFKRNNTGTVGEQGPNPSTYQWKEGEDNLRNKDLYIENVEFMTNMGLSGIGNSNLLRGTFEIFEPYGVTGAYEQLYYASRFAGHQNYIGAPFLLVLDFIGRKSDRVNNPETVDKATRHMPIRIARSEMRVEAGGTRYTFEFSGFTTISGMTGQVYGTIPKDISSPTKGDDVANYQTPVADRLNTGIVLYDFFRKLNKASVDKYKEYFTTYQEESSNNEFTPQQIAERQAGINQAAQQEQVPVITENQARTGAAANKYAIWWPQDYARDGYAVGGEAVGNQTAGQPFASNLADHEYDLYDSRAQDFLNIGFGIDQSSLSDYQMITESLPRTGNRTIERVQNNLEAQDRLIEDKEREIADKKRAINGIKTSIQTQVTTIVEQLRQLGAVEDADSLSGDLNKSLKEGTNDEISTALDGFINGTSQVQSRLRNEVDPGSIVAISNLLIQLQGLRDEFNTANGLLKELEQQETDLRQERQTIRTQPQQFYTGTPKWAWKESIMVKQVIDNVMLESTLVDTLNNQSSINQIKENEYVDWYIIHEIAKPIAFDPYKLDYQYQFNYYVQPYKIHYSQLPGLNVAFSYEIARSQSVREYNYIYTGKNVDVLNYDIVYNNLFSTPQLFSNADFKPLQLQENSEKLTDNQASLSPYASNIQQLRENLVGNGIVTMPNRSQRAMHIPLPINPNEAALGFQDFLLRPVGDQALIQAKIKIIGDPVYVIGSGIADRPKLTFDDIETTKGEVNIFNREADCIFNFGFPDDYPTGQELAKGKSSPGLQPNRYSGVYRIVRIQNYFQDGSFTQELELNRRPNQLSDYATFQRAQPVEVTQEVEIEGSGADEAGSAEQNAPVEAEGNAGGNRAVNPDDANPRVRNPQGVQTRIINSLAARTGQDPTAISSQITSKVQDARSVAGVIANGPPSNEEVIAAAIELYPGQFPSLPSGPAGIAQALENLNQPLPTQDQLVQRLATPGEPRPDILTVIDQGLEFSSRYVRAEELIGGIDLGDSRPGAVLVNRNTSAFDGGFASLNDETKYELDNLSADLGFPVLVNSASRTTAQQQVIFDNSAPGSAARPGNSQHEFSNAVDISTIGLSEAQKIEIISTASANGWTGIGTYENHIHLDRRDQVATWDTTTGNRYQTVLDQHRRGEFR